MSQNTESFLKAFHLKHPSYLTRLFQPLVNAEGLIRHPTGVRIFTATRRPIAP